MAETTVAVVVPSIDSKEKSILDELAHSETVRKLIECPVCLELPLPPIYLCNKGHIVCNSCQARTYACPLCREHYSSTRGFVAEGLIEKCILRCKYSDNGCPLSMRGSALVDHLEVCDYRPVKCIDCGGKLVNFDEYEEHLLKLHRINGIHQSRAYVIYSMNLQIAFGEKCCWPQYYLKAFDNVTFLLRLYATHWFVCAWISLLGPKCDCSKYEAMLEFHPTSDDSVVHTWQGPINHFRDDPAKDIFLQGRGLITPMETLMQITPVANDHAEWLYNIEIIPTTIPTDNQKTADEQTETSQTINSEEAVGEDSSESAAQDVSDAKTTAENDVCSSGAGGGDSGSGAPSAAVSIASQQQQVASSCADPPQRLGRIGSSSCRRLSDTPRIISTTPSCSTGRTPCRPSVAAQSAHILSSLLSPSTNSSSNNVVTSRPATLSQSSSILTAAATIASILPGPASPIDNTQSSSSTAATFTPASFPAGNNNNSGSGGTAGHTCGRSSESSTSPITVSTLRRPGSRLLSSIRRAAPFSYVFRSDLPTSRAYGYSEEDWLDFSLSGSDEE